MPSCYIIHSIYMSTEKGTLPFFQMFTQYYRTSPQHTILPIFMYTILFYTRFSMTLRHDVYSFVFYWFGFYLAKKSYKDSTLPLALQTDNKRSIFIRMHGIVACFSTYIFPKKLYFTWNYQKVYKSIPDF